MASIKDVVKGSLTYSIVPICTALLTLFVIPFVSYIYPADEYGKINLFYTVGSLGMSACLLGFDYYFMRKYYDDNEGCSPQTLFTLSLGVGLAVDVLISVIVLGFFRHIASQVLFGQNDGNGLILLSIYIACLIAFRLLNTMARMRGNAARFNTQSILQNLITRASFVMIAWYSTSYQWALLVMTLGMLVITALFMFKQRNECFQGAQFSSAISLLKPGFFFGMPCMLDAMATQLNSSIGKIVLSGYGLFDAVGVLAIATTLSTAFSMIPQAFGTFWAPFMYKNYKNEQSLIRTMHDLIMVLSIIITLLIYLFQDALFLLVGQSYKAGQVIFMLLMLVPIQSLICETTNYGIMLENKPIFGTVITSISVALCAIFTLVFVPSMGVNAVGIAVGISALTNGLLRSYVGCRLYQSINSWKKSLFSAFLIVVVCVSNSFLYTDLLARITVATLILLTASYIYRKQIHFAFIKLLAKRN